jgi:cytochrome c oxidase assembly protein subunit 11
VDDSLAGAAAYLHDSTGDTGRGRALKSRDNKNVTLRLVALAIGMFGFAFALVPLYDVICDLTGLNGRTVAQAALLEEITPPAAAQDRQVRVEFLAKAARGLPWEFRPLVNEMTVQIGKMNRATFYVRNRGHAAVTGQAVPSVAPGQAALYLKKIECFCFEQQELSAGGEMEMGVSFYVDAELPADISQLTLSYTMFNIGDVEHQSMVSHHE